MTAATPPADLVIELNHLISEHIGDLWTVAAGIVGIEILMVAHVLVLQKVHYSKSRVAIALSASARFSMSLR